MKVIIYTDGGARGNPGPAGIGVAVYDEKKNLVATRKQFIGTATNNQAEYKAVIFALRIALEIGARHLDFNLDSELVVRQLKGEYKVKNEQLKPLVQEVFKLSNKFDSIEYNHVPREKNKLADRLVNEAVDENT